MMVVLDSPGVVLRYMRIWRSGAMGRQAVCRLVMTSGDLDPIVTLVTSPWGELP